MVSIQSKFKEKGCKVFSSVNSKIITIQMIRFNANKKQDRSMPVVRIAERGLWYSGNCGYYCFMVTLVVIVIIFITSLIFVRLLRVFMAIIFFMVGACRVYFMSPWTTE
jgi:glucan phosphoethanolaminetransferase (alkaline phosphatase superfamily)